MTPEALLEYYEQLLIIQYRNLPKAQETIRLLSNQALCDGLPQTEQTCFGLDNAIGAQLTILGKIVGVPRNVYGLDLEHTFFSFTNYNSDPSIGFGRYNAQPDIDLWLRYNNYAIYSLTDFELRALIKLKIIYNNYWSSYKGIKDGLYTYFNGLIDMVDNGAAKDTSGWIFFNFTRYNGKPPSTGFGRFADSPYTDYWERYAYYTVMMVTYLVDESYANAFAAAIFLNIVPKPMAVGMRVVYTNASSSSSSSTSMASSSSSSSSRSSSSKSSSCSSSSSYSFSNSSFSFSSSSSSRSSSSSSKSSSSSSSSSLSKSSISSSSSRSSSCSSSSSSYSFSSSSSSSRSSSSSSCSSSSSKSSSSSSCSSSCSSSSSRSSSSRSSSSSSSSFNSASSSSSSSKSSSSSSRSSSSSSSSSKSSSSSSSSSLSSSSSSKSSSSSCSSSSCSCSSSSSSQPVPSSSSSSCSSSRSSSSSSSTNIDGYTTLLIHYDGASGDQPSPAATGQTVTYISQAQVEAPIVTPLANPNDTGVLVLNGTTDYIASPNSTDWDFGSGEFTVDLWANFTTLPASGNYMALVAHHDATDNNRSWYLIIQNDGGNYKLYTTYSSDGGFLPAYTHTFASSAVSLTIGTWHHYVLQRLVNTGQLYFDGVNVGEFDLTGFTYFNADKPLTIGASNAGSRYYFNGYIDEVRVSKGIARWSGDFTVPTVEYSSDANTSILLHLDTTPIVDSSSNAHSITAYGVSYILNPIVMPLVNPPDTAYLSLTKANRDYCRVPYFSGEALGTGAFTLDMWLYIPTGAVGGTVMAMGTAGNTFTEIKINDGSITLRTATGGVYGTYVATAYTAIYDQWFHVAVERLNTNGDATAWFFAVNGVQHAVSKHPAGAWNGNLPNFGSDYYIGYEFSGGTGITFGGYIDEYRLSNGIARWTSSPFTPPTTEYPNGQ